MYNNYFLNFSIHNYYEKIGEGVYGEVFTKKILTGEIIVLKIIPIEGSLIVNGETQKKFDEILPEVLISMKLSELRNGINFSTSGFVEVKRIRCVQGRYPDHLISHWEAYSKKKKSENDNPKMFPEDQMYIVIELASAGVIMETFKFLNATQALSTFKQVRTFNLLLPILYSIYHRSSLGFG